MPGPGTRRQKPKPKKPTQPPFVSLTDNPISTFAIDIDHEEGWHVIVDMLCKHLQLPDLTTRRGLKKVHVDFERIYSRMNTVYNNNLDKEKITGGIVGIWAKMSTDSILRNKLFEKGFLEKLWPLLGSLSTRHMALVALASITHHGGGDVRTEIAKQSPLLVRIMREDPKDSKTIELATVTLCHAVQAVLLVNDQVPDWKLVKSLGIKDIIDVTLENIRKLPTSPLMVQHAIPLLATPTMHCWEICIEHKSLLNFLAACLRCSDIIVRCDVMGGFIRLHDHDAQVEFAPLDHQKLIQTYLTGGFKNPRISDVMMKYGPEKMDIVNTLTTATAFQKAMQAAIGNKNLVQLGRTLAGLVVQTEFSISDGWYQSIDPKTGRMEATDVGLPFTRWRDALPICAAELRKTGLVLDADRADILEIKYYVMTQNLKKAIPMAKAAIERNPDVAYYYYAVSLTGNTEEGLRYSKKGMKCAQITPFLKYCMMRRAVEFACDQGLMAVLDPQPGGEKRELGFAFLQSAMEDSKEFMEHAPPDSRHMEGVIDWNVLVTLTNKGPEVSPDLRELKPVLEKRELAGAFLELTGIPHQKTFPILTARTVLDHYGPGVEEWGSIVESLNKVIEGSPEYEFHKPAPTTKEDKEHELAAWLNNLDLEGEEGEGEDFRGCANPKASPKGVELCRCTHCGNPSAVLRKCKCNKVRYCDTACQKQDWKKHKPHCSAVSRS